MIIVPSYVLKVKLVNSYLDFFIGGYDNMSETKNGRGRTRNFATIVYPESAPENWKSILENEIVPALISPLHDKDINADGEKKKAHYHVIIMFDTVKTEEQAKKIFDKIGGVGCQKINVIRNYARYLCHLDNPEKVQYNTKDVIKLCGADYDEIISLASDKYKVIDEMIDFCEKYDITSFYLLSKYAFKNNDQWKKALADNCSVFMREYLKSKQWSVDNKQVHIVDEETGEVII